MATSCDLGASQRATHCWMAASFAAVATVVMAAIATVGMKVATFWKTENEWYAGTIVGTVGQKHRINYRDGDTELVDMSRIRWVVDTTARVETDINVWPLWPTWSFVHSTGV